MIKSATKFFISFIIILLCGYSFFYAQVAPANPDILSFDLNEHAEASNNFDGNKSLVSPYLPGANQEKVSIERSLVENEEEDEDESSHKIYSVTGSYFTVLYSSESFSLLFQNIQKSIHLSKLLYSSTSVKKFILIEVFRI